MKYLASKVQSVTVLAVLAVMLAVSAPTPGAAQDLAREIDRLKRDMADLQRFVYAGKEPPSSGGSAGAAEATASATEQGLPPDIAGRMQIRFQQMEEQMRDLTGRLEEVQFSIRRTERRVEKLAEDVEFRLDQLEQRVSGGPVAQNSQNQGTQPPLLQNSGSATAQSAGTTGAVQSSGENLSETTVISSAGAEGPGAKNSGTQNAEGQNPDGQASGARSLGSLTLSESGEITGGTVNPNAQASADEIARQPTEPPPPSTVENSGSVASVTSGGEALPEEPKALYEHALTLLLRNRDYGAAQGALETYIDRYPNENRVGAATYWLGESHYVRQNYRDAAFAFVDVYSKYPKSTKVADSLLKLGMSLQALGQTSDACTALQTLKQDYADAKKTVLTIADQKIEEFGCP